MRIRLPWFGLRLGRAAALPARGPAPAAPEKTDIPLAAILGNLAEGIVVADERRRILLCNDPLSRLINRPPNEALGLPLWEALRHREINDMAERALRTGHEETSEIPFTLPADMVWRVRARAFPLGNARGVLLTFSDITDIRRLENLRKDFVANVSHELKTPLTALRAALETLLEGALDDRENARDFLQTAQSQVERLQRLIDDLLALSRLEKMGPTPGASASLPPVAEKALATLAPMAQKAGVSLEASLPGDLPPLAISTDELTQVLLNLLDNAVKFNQPGGRAALAARPAQGGVEISVSDSGMGIPLEDQPRIFERFYRVDKARSRDLGGTGLGLAIVKHIVENRRGSVSVRSAPGQGAEFLVILPRFP